MRVFFSFFFFFSLFILAVSLAKEPLANHYSKRGVWTSLSRCITHAVHIQSVNSMAVHIQRLQRLAGAVP